MKRYVLSLLFFLLSFRGTCCFSYQERGGTDSLAPIFVMSEHELLLMENTRYWTPQEMEMATTLLFSSASWSFASPDKKFYELLDKIETNPYRYYIFSNVLRILAVEAQKNAALAEASERGKEFLA